MFNRKEVTQSEKWKKTKKIIATIKLRREEALEVLSQNQLGWGEIHQGWNYSNDPNTGDIRQPGFFVSGSQIIAIDDKTTLNHPNRISPVFRSLLYLQMKNSARRENW